MDRRPTLILNMLLDTCRRRPTMHPIRTPTGNMDGGTRSMKSTNGKSTIKATNGKSTITTTISSSRCVAAGAQDTNSKPFDAPVT